MSSRLALLGGEPVRKEPFPNWPIHGPGEDAAVLRVARSGQWGIFGAPEVARFEEDFARYQGAEYGIAVTSGTVALRISLIAAGIGAGDEVLIPAYTFQATASAIAEANAVPVTVDIDPQTYTMDPRAAEAAITPRTKAMMPVHFAGQAADMDPLLEIAERHGLIVIEDAAQAHGAEDRGRRVGSMGLFGCFSFQASKNLNCGEGGFITTSDVRMAERCRAIHNCGRYAAGTEEEWTIAGNYRITEFQGAILNCQLARLDEQMAVRERNAACLSELLADVPGITPQGRPARVTRHAYHLFSFHYDEKVFGAPREAFIRALNAEGIPATPGYTTPIYCQPMFAREAYGPYAGAKRHAPPAPCPVAERVCGHEGAWLYQKVLLGPEGDMEDIARAFAKVYENREQLRSTD